MRELAMLPISLVGRYRASFAGTCILLLLCTGIFKLQPSSRSPWVLHRYQSPVSGVSTYEASIDGGPSNDGLLDISPQNRAANSTLGFEKILALSTGPSWRSRGLQAAASITNLSIEIPDHPIITTELVDAFRAIGDPETTADFPPPGAAKAWLSHLNLLAHVVQSGFETTLILEDDVDWDLAVKDQVRLVSSNVRQFTNTSDSDSSPYGTGWDVLWFGHCGEVTRNTTKRLEYYDPTVLPLKNQTGWSTRYKKQFGEGQRLIQECTQPVCTFAYAVTRAGAQKVLDWTGSGQDEAFDVRLMRACFAPPEESFRMITVNPEIMHHYEPPHEAGYWSEVNAGDGKGVPKDERLFEGVMGGTENIRNSARCKALFGTTCIKTFPAALSAA